MRTVMPDKFATTEVTALLLLLVALKILTALLAKYATSLREFVMQIHRNAGLWQLINKIPIAFARKVNIAWDTLIDVGHLAPLIKTAGFTPTHTASSHQLPADAYQKNASKMKIVKADSVCQCAPEMMALKVSAANSSRSAPTTLEKCASCDT
jgi:hypothetical protein